MSLQLLKARVRDVDALQVARVFLHKRLKLAPLANPLEVIPATPAFSVMPLVDDLELPGCRYSSKVKVEPLGSLTHRPFIDAGV